MEPQVFLGIDVGKSEHHATAVNHEGKVVHDKPLPQSEPKIQELLKDLVAKYGELLVVVDQPKTIGALVIAVAQYLGIQVAYLLGLTMLVAVAGRRNAEGFFEDLRDQDLGLYMQLKPISSDYIPEAAAVAGLDRDELIRNGLGPKDAMRTLIDWLNEQAGNDRPVMAAYPLSYDWMWVYWYLMRYAGMSPFGYSSGIDINTLFATKSNRMIRKVGKRSMPKKLLSKRPHTHPALDDAWEQADLLVNLLHWDPSLYGYATLTLAALHCYNAL